MCRIHDGIIFPQDLEGAFRHPVAMSHFKKCTGEAKVKLDPGQMKDIRLAYIEKIYI